MVLPTAVDFMYNFLIVFNCLQFVSIFNACKIKSEKVFGRTAHPYFGLNSLSLCFILCFLTGINGVQNGLGFVSFLAKEI